jgi:hypothetical protein
LERKHLATSIMMHLTLSKLMPPKREIKNSHNVIAEFIRIGRSE